MGETLTRFFVSAVRYLVLVITVIMMLSQFGVQMASLLVVLSTAGLVIGLALQGRLSNVAAGVMLLLFRPFKIGDFVEVSVHASTVQAISLFVTEMSTPDNVYIVVPNSQVWGSFAVNFSYNSTRRVDIVVGIGYEDDIDKAMDTIVGVISGDSRTHGDPEPMVAVMDLVQRRGLFGCETRYDQGDQGGLGRRRRQYSVPAAHGPSGQGRLISNSRAGTFRRTPASRSPAPKGRPAWGNRAPGRRPAGCVWQSPKRRRC